MASAASAAAAAAAAAAQDSGLIAVNMDDAILSSKVLFNEHESILLLTATHIICREFAGRRDTFVLPLDQLLGLNEDATNPRAFVIVGTFAHPQNPTISIQQNLRIVCAEPQEAHEWIDTAQAVLTDRNIRSVNAQEQVPEQQRRSTALTAGLAELADMFPGVPTDLLKRVLEQHNYNVSECVEPLLAVSDPSGPPVAEVVQTTPAPIDDSARQAMQMQIAQDELFARMLADQLFHEELQRSGALRVPPAGQAGVHPVSAMPVVAPAPNQTAAATAGSANASAAVFDEGTEAATSTGQPSSSIVDNIQKMSEAAKRSLTQTYRKFLTLRSRNRDESMTGEEMTALHLGTADDEADAHELGEGAAEADAAAVPPKQFRDIETVKAWLGHEEEEEDEDDADRLVSNRGKGLAHHPAAAATGAAAAATASAPAPAAPAPTAPGSSVPTANLIDLDL